MAAELKIITVTDDGLKKMQEELGQEALEDNFLEGDCGKRYYLKRSRKIKCVQWRLMIL